MSDKKNPQSLDVTDAISKSEAFVIKYKNKLIAGIVAVVVVVGAFFGAKAYIDSRNEEAQSLCTDGLAYLAQGDYEKALKGEGKFPGYVKIADQYGMTDGGNLAKLYAGLCYYHSNADLKDGKKVKKAIEYLESWSPKSDHSVSAMGLFALANCYAADNQIDKAISTFEDAADKADNEALSPLCLLEAGKLLEKQGNKQKAAKLYRSIKEDYPASQLAQPQGTPSGVIGDAEIDRYIERASN